MKSKLSFYTNIPSPYNLDLFEELSKYFQLQVIYYSKTESGRQWFIDTENIHYSSVVLENNFIGRLINKFKNQFHFSSGILSILLKDDSESVIIGGNYFSPNTYIILLFSKINRKKIYWFGEKLLPDKSLFHNCVKRLLLLPIFKSCNGLLCVGNAAIQSYKSYGFKGECYNIPYSIKNSSFDKNTLEPTKLAEYKLKLNPDNKFVILTSGSLIHRKGIDIVIKAYFHLPFELKSKTQLWIAGDGPLMSDLEKMANQNSEIIFLGFVDPKELPYFFSLATIFLFCSRYDGWAVVINEALSAELPVVVSNNVAASELIKNWENGLICDSENLECYVSAVSEILENDELRNLIKRNNREKSKKIDSFTIARKIKKIITNE